MQYIPSEATICPGLGLHLCDSNKPTEPIQSKTHLSQCESVVELEDEGVCMASVVVAVCWVVLCLISGGTSDADVWMSLHSDL